MGAQSPGFFSNQIVNTLGKRDRRQQQQMKGRITLFLKPGFLTTRVETITNIDTQRDIYEHASYINTKKRLGSIVD